MSEYAPPRYKLTVLRTSYYGNDPTHVEGSLAVVCAALHELTKASYALDGLHSLKVEQVNG